MTQRLTSIGTMSSRSDAGRKIDTWRVSLPDGTALINVSMRNSPQGTVFSASTEGHDLLMGMSWIDPDINQLRERAHADIDARVKSELGSQWHEALLLEIEGQNRSDNRSNRLGFQFDLQPISVDSSAPADNLGSVRIRQADRTSVIIARGPHAIFEHKKDLSPENMTLARENSRNLSRAVVAGDTAAAIADLQQTLKSFHDCLIVRLSPEQLKFSGAPDAQEVIAILQAALEAHSPKSPDEGPAP